MLCSTAWMRRWVPHHQRLSYAVSSWKAAVSVPTLSSTCSRNHSSIRHPPIKNRPPTMVRDSKTMKLVPVPSVDDGPYLSPVSDSAVLLSNLLVVRPGLLRFSGQKEIQETLTAAGWKKGIVKASFAARGGWSMILYHRARHVARIQFAAAGGYHDDAYWKVSSRCSRWGTARIRYLQHGDVPKVTPKQTSFPSLK